MTPRSAQKLADEGLEFYKVSPDQLFGKFLATAVINPKTGEIIADAGAELNEEVLTNISAAKVGEIKVLYIDNVNVGPYIRNTLEADKTITAKKLCWISIALCVRVNRLPMKRLISCSVPCSLTMTVMTCRLSVV